jgi:hypothetical protein
MMRDRRWSSVRAVINGLRATHLWLLAFPWLVLWALVWSENNGLVQNVVDAIPGRVGKIAWKNALAGVFLLFTGCSFFWAFRVNYTRGHRGTDLTQQTFFVGMAVTFIHFMILALLAAG